MKIQLTASEKRKFTINRGRSGHTIKWNPPVAVILAKFMTS